MAFYKVTLQMKKEKELKYDPVITIPQDIVDFINKEEQYNLAINEHIIVIALNTKNRIMAYTEIGAGNTNFCNINIADIFRFVLTTPASKFVLAHNHPSGETTPSKQDIDVTKMIKDASKLMEVQFLDHIIIGDNKYTSIFEYMERGN